MRQHGNLFICFKRSKISDKTTRNAKFLANSNYKLSTERTIYPAALALKEVRMILDNKHNLSNRKLREHQPSCVTLFGEWIKGLSLWLLPLSLLEELGRLSCDWSDKAGWLDNSTVCVCGHMRSSEWEWRSAWRMSTHHHTGSWYRPQRQGLSI